MRKIIGITGKARSGKDTVAKHLWAEYGFTRIALADPLKASAQVMFGLTDKQTWDDDLKEIEIPYWGMSPRRMFQLLGNDAVKPVFGNNVWLDRFKLSYATVSDTDDVVVPDIRFDHEANMIREMGGTVIHLIRDDCQQVAAHVSEAGISRGHKDDVFIRNNGSIEDLHGAVDVFLSSL